MMANDTNQKSTKVKSNKSVKRFVVLGVIALLVFFAVFQVGKVTLYHNGLDTTKRTLILLRKSVEAFRGIEGKSPRSLKEMIEYGQAHPDAGVTQIYRKEFISSSEGNGQEHVTLNGQGGWYYTQETGTVKINIIKPVKTYLKYYYGPKRNEIPCKW